MMRYDLLPRNERWQLRSFLLGAMGTTICTGVRRGGEAGRDASKVLCFPSLGIHNIYMMIICFPMNERPLPRGLGVCGGRGEGEWKRCLKDSFSFPSSASILYIYI